MRDQSVKIYSLQLRVVGAFVLVAVVLVGVARVVAVGAVDELVVESVVGVVTGGVVVVLVGRLFLQFTPRFAARSAQRVSVTLRTENVWRAGSRETVMSTKRSREFNWYEFNWIVAPNPAYFGERSMSTGKEVDWLPSVLVYTMWLMSYS